MGCIKIGVGGEEIMQKTYLTGAIAAIIVIFGAYWFSTPGDDAVVTETAVTPAETSAAESAPATVVPEPTVVATPEPVIVATPEAAPVEPVAVETAQSTEETAPVETVTEVVPEIVEAEAEPVTPLAVPLATPEMIDADVADTADVVAETAETVVETVEQVTEVAVPEVAAPVAPTPEQITPEGSTPEATTPEPTAIEPTEPETTTTEVVDTTVSEPAPAETTPVEPETVEALPDLSVAQTDDAQDTTEDTAPSFEIVRVERDGATIVAGRAQPGAEVDVTLDGETVATVNSDRSGNFVALMDTPATGAAQEMQLVTRDENNDAVASRETIVVLVEAPEEEPAQADITPAEATTEDDTVAANTTNEQTEQPARPVIVRSTDEGVEVVQSSQSLADEQVSIDTISYSITGDVVLTGRGASEALLVIYADADPVGRGRVRDDGRWRVILGDIEAGIYTLRIDQLDGMGDVVSRAETPFQRVFPDVQAVADPAPATDDDASADVVNVDQADTMTLAEAAEMVDAVADTDVVAQDASAAEAPAAPPSAPPAQIIVQPGNNLWTIARVQYGEGIRFTQIFDANADQIRDPNLIFPGQIFTLPAEE